MLGMQTLDVAIGLIFIYLLLALICTGINELLAGWRDKRTKNLMLGIRNLLFEPEVKLTNPRTNQSGTLDKLFLDHPLIKSLKEDGTPPSYIPSKTFALAVIDIIAPAGSAGANTLADIRAAVAAKLPGASDVRTSLLLIIDQAGNDLQKAHSLIETWFNDAMDRISAWYKQKSQWTIITIALIVTCAAGADTIQITKSLVNDPAIRNALVAQAQETVTNVPALPSANSSGASIGANCAACAEARAKAKEELDKNIAKLNSLGLKLGWQGEPSNGWGSKIIGLFITAFAASLGASFWFDLLNKFMTIRAVGKSPAEKEKARKQSDTK